MSRVEAGPGFALALAWLLLFGDPTLLLPLLLAAAAHELGHVLALYTVGERPRGLRLGMTGAELAYTGALAGWRLALGAAAGPLAGLGYALLCARLGRVTGSGFWYTGAGLSLALALFNLLPAWPLDGGRLLEAAGRRPVLSGLLAGAALCGAGIWRIAVGGGTALFTAGLCLLAFQTCQTR